MPRSQQDIPLPPLERSHLPTTHLSGVPARLHSLLAAGPRSTPVRHLHGHGGRLGAAVGDCMALQHDVPEIRSPSQSITSQSVPRHSLLAAVRWKKPKRQMHGHVTGRGTVGGATDGVGLSEVSQHWEPEVPLGRVHSVSSQLVDLPEGKHSTMETRAANPARHTHGQSVALHSVIDASIRMTMVTCGIVELAAVV